MTEELDDDEIEYSFGEGGFSPGAPFRYPEYRLFFIATVLANLGEWMQQFVLGWFAVELAVAEGHPDRGPFYLGLLGFGRLVPGLGLGLLGGVFADRQDRRRILVATRIWSALVIFVMAVLTLSGAMTMLLLVALIGCSAAAFAFDGPARLSLVPRLVAPQDALSAIGLTRSTMVSASLVGPLAGGLLIVPLGIGGVMVVNTGLYVLAAFTMAWLRPSPPLRRFHRGTPIDSIVEGLRHVRGDPTLWSLMLVTALFGAFAFSFGQLLPAVAHDTLRAGARELSWMASGSGVGALAGAIVVTSMGGWRRPGGAIVFSALATGSLLVAFGLQRSVLPAVILCVLVGCASMIFAGVSGNLLQILVADRYRGRVVGLHSTLFQVFSPAGVLLLGALGSVVGVSNVLVGAGLVVACAGVVMLRGGAIRKIGAT